MMCRQCAVCGRNAECQTRIGGKVGGGVAVMCTAKAPTVQTNSTSRRRKARTNVVVALIVVAGNAGNAPNIGYARQRS